MSLLLQIEPGDQIAIDNKTFRIEAALCVVAMDGQTVALTEDNIQLMPNVLVRSAQSPTLPGFAVAITVPKDISITRIKKGQI